MSRFLHSVFALIRKDFAIERRTRESFTIMLVFAFSLLFILSFALDQNILAKRDGAAGLIWIILMLAGQLGLNQSMGVEKQGNLFEALVAAPISRSAIYLSKTISAFLFMYGVALILHPLYSVLYNVPLQNLHFVWIALLGCWGYTALGCLISAMTIQTRARDTLLPILFYPLIIPLLIAAIKTTELLFAGASFADASYWINQIVVFDIIFTAAGILGFDIIAEE